MGMSDRWLKERSADAERRFREMVAVGEVPFHGVLSLLQELAGYGGCRLRVSALLA